MESRLLYQHQIKSAFFFFFFFNREERLRFWSDPDTELRLAKDTGITVYRMGVDWTRIMPVEPIDGIPNSVCVSDRDWMEWFFLAFACSCSILNPMMPIQCTHITGHNTIGTCIRKQGIRFVSPCESSLSIVPCLCVIII
jgi:hypothetical protein